MTYGAGVGANPQNYCDQFGGGIFSTCFCTVLHSWLKAGKQLPIRLTAPKLCPF